jgi:hypothetical protein
MSFLSGTTGNRALAGLDSLSDPFLQADSITHIIANGATKVGPTGFGRLSSAKHLDRVQGSVSVS